MSEEDIKFRFITPAIEKSDWSKENIRMEYYFTEGKVIVNGNKTSRNKAKKADYLLSKNGIFPLAVIEAKNFEHTADAGLQQAMNYTELLALPFAYSSNANNLSAEQEKVMLEPDYRNAMKNRTARYYQQIAIDKTIQAVIQAQEKLL